MAGALDELLRQCQRYIIAINRTSFNWDTGESRSPSIVLFESEHPVTEQGIDPRIVKARNVTIVVTVSDGGTAIIYMKQRRLQILTPTAELNKVLSRLQCATIARRITLVTRNATISIYSGYKSNQWLISTK